ncbi:MAG: glycosyltransferase [Candidatus Hydrogenedens sp.]|nr:glycosyltransferase [Candidatus Hydrogenedens sp.]
MLTVAHLDEQDSLRGGEQQATWLVRGLLDRGVRCLVIGRPGRPFIQMHEEEKELLRIPLPLRGELDLYSAWKLASIVNRHEVDIVHAHASHAHGIAVLARLFGGRHQVVVTRRVNFTPKSHFLNRWKYKSADRILCVSQKVADTLNDYGLSAPQIKTVHSAVDIARAEMPPVSRESLSIPPDVPFLFSAGSLVDHKDHANLLDAFARVRKEFPDAQLCIAGEGPLREKLEARRTQLNLTESVHFLGYRNDAPGITRTADLYISSSWSEGLGTSILEALASGTPVVAAEAGGAREMVVPGETGYLVAPRDDEALAEAMIRSLKNREEARAMAEKAISFVREKFSVERMVSGSFDAYEELMG